MAEITMNEAPDFIHGSGGVRLAIDRYGKETDPPVLLMHGGGQTRHAWGATARMLAKRGYYVLSMDLRGHGDSEWSPTTDYTLSAHRDDVLAVLATVKQPAILIGASLGGISALLAAGEGPRDKIRALVLVDITPAPLKSGSDKIRNFMTSHPEGFETIDQAADAVAEYLPHRPRPKDPSGLMKNLRPRNGRLFWHWDPKMLDVMVADRLAENDRLVKAARAVTAPTLLVRGEESEIVSEAEVETFKAMMPKAEVVVVKGARHMVAGDQNTQFGDAVLEYLDRTVLA